MEVPVRTKIVISDKLMLQALKLTGFKTKREAVEAGLEMLVKMARQRHYARRGASSAGKAISTRCGAA